MSLSGERSEIIKNCIEFMRQLSEGTGQLRGDFKVTLPDGGSGGIVNHFQNGSTYSSLKNSHSLRDVIVDLLDPPSMPDGKMLTGGMINSNILEVLVERLEKGELRDFKECQQWIATTTQLYVNYIHACVEHHYGNRREPPEKPAVLGNALCLAIYRAIADPNEFKSEGYNLWKPNLKITKEVEAFHMPNLNEEKIHSDKSRETKIQKLFAEAQQLRSDKNTTDYTKLAFFKKASGKINKYCDKELLSPEKAVEINNNLVNILGIKNK